MNDEPVSPARPDRRTPVSPEVGLTRREELGVSSWDLAVLVATVVVAAAMPLEVVRGPLEERWLQVVSGVSSLLFAVDILNRFSRPVVIGGRPVTERAVVQRRYLRRWFAIDLLAAIPFDLIATVPGIAGTGAATVLRVFALLRVLRVARILVLQREWRVKTSFNPAVLRLVFFAFWISMVSHWIACGWIALDGPESGHPELAPYQQALYWTITTLTTVGYGDIAPFGRSQVAYAMVVMALGAAMYGYIIGNVASLIANLDVVRSRHLGRMEKMNHFMRDRRVPRELQARVRDYYNYAWESRMGQQSEMLADLPKSLHIEIALHLNRNILRTVPLFERASETFLRELVLYLEPRVAMPGEAIVRRGEMGRKIFFINRGRVEVLSPDESVTVATLSEGSFFGEMALLSSEPRANTVRAIEYCDLYELDREEFDIVLNAFPDFAAEVRQVAARRRSESEPES